MPINVPETTNQAVINQQSNDLKELRALGFFEQVARPPKKFLFFPVLHPFRELRLFKNGVYQPNKHPKPSKLHSTMYFRAFDGRMPL